MKIFARFLIALLLSATILPEAGAQTPSSQPPAGNRGPVVTAPARGFLPQLVRRRRQRRRAVNNARMLRNARNAAPRVVAPF
ncbi:MAG: hypothetical protein P4L84_12150 [Isosphaeraceae bacterium]|nr:hypothetical protein [Isosphaeraceae bacterium]